MSKIGDIRKTGRFGGCDTLYESSTGYVRQR